MQRILQYFKQYSHLNALIFIGGFFFQAVANVCVAQDSPTGISKWTCSGKRMGPKYSLKQPVPLGNYRKVKLCYSKQVSNAWTCLCVSSIHALARVCLPTNHFISPDPHNSFLFWWKIIMSSFRDNCNLSLCLLGASVATRSHSSPKLSSTRLFPLCSAHAIHSAISWVAWIRPRTETHVSHSEGEDYFSLFHGKLSPHWTDDNCCRRSSCTCKGQDLFSLSYSWQSSASLRLLIGQRAASSVYLGERVNPSENSILGNTYCLPLIHWLQGVSKACSHQQQKVSIKVYFHSG